MYHIEFLTDTQIIQKINSLFQISKEIKCAVAFWGKGSLKQMGLLSKNKNVKIICNLSSGASNPEVVESLMDYYGDNIKISDTLHAKVYYTENGAIIGSANASANGLNFEGQEIMGWTEACLFIDDPIILQNTREWFNKIWSEGRNIGEKDLKLAKKRWLTRRDSRIFQTRDSTSLLTNLKDFPDDFKGRRVYFAIWSTDAVKEAETKFEEIRTSKSNIIDGISNNRLDFWQDWKRLPKECKLICLKRSNDKIIEHGYVKMPFEKIVLPFKSGKEKGSINICYKIKDIDGLKLSKADINLLKNKLGELFKNGKGDAEARYIPLLEASTILFP